MVAHALLACGLEPAYLIGGALRTTGLNADWGTGEWLIVEADESDRSMLALDAEVVVVTNVELDHHATFGSLAELRAAFAELLAEYRRPCSGSARTWCPCAAAVRTSASTSRRPFSRTGARASPGGGSTSASRSPGCTTRATLRRRWRPAGWRAPNRVRPPRRC
jgi:UDP-N-acetylmuramate--alanine ligase